MPSGLLYSRRDLVKLKFGFEPEINCRRQVKRILPPWLREHKLHAELAFEMQD